MTRLAEVALRLASAHSLATLQEPAAATSPSQEHPGTLAWDMVLGIGRIRSVQDGGDVVQWAAKPRGSSGARRKELIFGVRCNARRPAHPLSSRTGRFGLHSAVPVDVDVSETRLQVTVSCLINATVIKTGVPSDNPPDKSDIRHISLMQKFGTASPESYPASGWWCGHYTALRSHKRCRSREHKYVTRAWNWRAFLMQPAVLEPHPSCHFTSLPPTLLRANLPSSLSTLDSRFCACGKRGGRLHRSVDFLVVLRLPLPALCPVDYIPTGAEDLIVKPLTISRLSLLFPFKLPHSSSRDDTLRPMGRRLGALRVEQEAFNTLSQQRRGAPGGARRNYARRNDLRRARWEQHLPCAPLAPLPATATPQLLCSQASPLKYTILHNQALVKPSVRRRSILISITFVVSQDLAVNSRPNLFTRSLIPDPGVPGCCHLTPTTLPSTALLPRGRGGVVVRPLAFHLGESGSIPGGAAAVPSLVGIVPGTMPLFGVFSRGSPVYPALTLWRRSTLTSLHPHPFPRPDVKVVAWANSRTVCTAPAENVFVKKPSNVVSAEGLIETHYRRQDLRVEAIRVDAHISVAPSAPMLLGLRRAEFLRPGGHLRQNPNRHLGFMIRRAGNFNAPSKIEALAKNRQVQDGGESALRDDDTDGVAKTTCDRLAWLATGVPR
ncbi:hypothetical protein PR048_021868 [Dryococelus australis]|uniref:Uncharacterized protein n=1 Tax=Dryococelus australis TaxID=614101 RepID=A0ABQ9GZE9_9NEOP|nr:hypothetical protein PR048_021868 [Dryococelus australis]